MTATGLGSAFEQTLVYGRTRKLPDEVGGHPPFELLALPDLVRDPHPIHDAVALVKLYRLMRRRRVDLVHTHTSKAGILGRVAARLAGVPALVHTPHGHIFTGEYASTAWLSLFVRLERWAATFTDRLVCLTHQEARDHLARGIGRPQQFVTIPSGVDVERFAMVEPPNPDLKVALGLPATARVVGSVGRLEPVKGHRYLLEAVARLAPRLPDLQLVLAGEGELRVELAAIAARAGLRERVCFAGWRDDVPDVLGALDLFVLPSLNEGMGKALVEAMAAGLPIVACRVGGIPEVLGDGEAGLLVEPASADALARGIEAVLEDPALAARLAKAARARASRYGVGAMLGRVEALYRELLGDAAP